MLRCSWQETWDFISVNPARFMGLSCGLVVGQPASFCLLQSGASDRLQQLRVFVNGEPG
jgi:dihydroorotase-like cyclic amidohydrolase